MVVQPNLPEDADWSPVTAEMAERRLVDLTAAAAPAGKTDLMVWPNRRVRFITMRTQAFVRRLRCSRERSTRGSSSEPWRRHVTGQPLNSAVMLAPDGHLVDRYDKMYLVPFGEFIPPLFGWVNRISQEAGDFSPGQRVVVVSGG